MLLPIVLIIGCAVWIVNESFSIVTVGLADIVGTTASISNLLLGVGIWIFWQDRDSDPLARTASVLVSAGMLLLALRSLSFALSGTRAGRAEFVASPVFAVAGAAIGLGVVLLGLWMVRSRAYPLWIGLGLIGLTFLALGIAFLPEAGTIQSMINIVLALILAETALIAMGRARNED